ncbi:MAG: glycine cleavage system aminomethyltransferase GcvT [Defluviicoccus sp.]|nr:glycine cleavage system aminomethyltransferase GcvT [Defluviicoccus sp.]
MSDPETATVKTTPLNALHRELGARMAPFAGYDMPIQYAGGIIEEHLHTRRAASLFDVSHMGQLVIRGEERATALEALVPGDIAGLAPGGMRYTMLTDEAGGILDDLIVTDVGTYLFVVVNAACKEADIAHVRAALPGGCELDELDRGLVALQGPRAGRALTALVPGADALPFMTAAPFEIDGVRLAVTRSGYTGEDGFEISIPAEDTERIARMLLDLPEVEPAGLGARDTLRLEAGLCLYGQDIDRTTTPVEAGLAWTVGKRRRAEGGFPGAGVILDQIASGPSRRRVGIRPDGRAPARAHTTVREIGGEAIGEITSGGFGPSVGGPVAMGYVAAGASGPGRAVEVVVRDKPLPARIAKLPFVPHRYFKGKGG